MQGRLTLTTFNKQRQETVKQMSEDDTIDFFESLGLHRFNNKCNENVISLHIYTPAHINSECQNEVPIIYELIKPLGDLCEIKKLQLSSSSPQIFTSFNALADILRVELANETFLDRPQSTIERISKLLESMRFNPKEIKQYAHWDSGHYTRNLIAYDEKFTLLLLCWDKKQYSPIHSHAESSCWMKMVQGSLQEIRYVQEEDEKE